MTEERINPILMELVAPYLKRRSQELLHLRALLADRDFGAIRVLGRKLNESAATYGFTWLSRTGASLDEAAGRSDETEIHLLLSSIDEHLRNIAVTPA